MRKVAAISLLLLLLAPFACFHAGYRWARYRLRQSVREKVLAGLPVEALTKFCFLKAEIRKRLRWENSDEFVLEGQWYDVVRQEQRGDTLILWCLPDRAENALERAQRKQLIDFWAHECPMLKTFQRLQQFLLSLFWATVGIWFALNTLLLNQKLAGHAEQIFSQVCFPPPFPPPERDLDTLLHRM
ncbi:MAG: hypothetical protein NZM43_12210 [Saprospiraceae bacterium]|nr:hypothetical protein [Saprospiraceae bacterium]MDW8485075.1 hypothetical protein [Saprospiraceae bacterium]